MEWISDPQAWIGFATLTVLEIVLGIDNIIFISLQAERLPEEQRDRARLVGLGLALILRIGLLCSLGWVMGLTEDLFTIFGHSVTGRDLVLLLGGVFLIAKAVSEIHEKVEGNEEERAKGRAGATFTRVIIQILLLDIVFSLDSVITAVGMVDEIAIMIAAVVIAIGIMMVAAKKIAAFVNGHPTVQMLALSFLLLIGFTLTVDGLQFHIPKGYIYFAMGFSIFVEMMNLKLRKKSEAT